MHARRDRRIDHIYRLRCRECGAEGFAELGGEKEQRAEQGASVEVPCGQCGRIQPHTPVIPEADP